MRIGLVTDSACDLPADLVERYKIEVAPSILVLDGQSYLDGVEITRETFYTRLPALRSTPTTAAPAQAIFAGYYRKLLAQGCEHVIGIFTAEKLTSISNIARSAAVEFFESVNVIESGSLSLGIGYQVLAAAEAIEQGLALPVVLTAIQSTRERLHIYAALDTIEYLRRSGRVPQAVATLGGLLSIKPVVELREGVVRAMGVPRTTRQATEKLYSLLVGLGRLERLSILHTNAEKRANQFLERLTSDLGAGLPADVRIVNVTTVIGTHVGPNGLGLAVVTR
jgi:DegV family protein with EDD domain